MDTTSKAARPRKGLRILALDMRDSVFTGVLFHARTAGWLVSPSRYFSGGPEQIAQWWSADGILIGGQLRLRSAVAQWQASGIPMVSCSGIGQPSLTKPTVTLDWHEAGRLAGMHLIERGFRQLAYCYMAKSPWIDGQVAGLRCAAAAGGGTVHVLDWQREYHTGGSPYRASLRRWLGERLKALPKPLGLLVDDDWTALEAVEACRERDVAVPDQVAVVGIGNNEVFCDNAPVPLSSVNLDYERLGRDAAALLDKLMRGRPAPKKPILIPPRGVVCRRSSDIMASEHPDVSKALRHMWRHYRDVNLDVPSIVSVTAMSKTGLNLAFRKYMNRSIGRLLLEIRLKCAQKLMATTNLKMRQIAQECGFREFNTLRSVLIRETGMGPRAWRQKNSFAPEAG
ncbi:MAG: substrate-binding domain-containing protein [Planctomycetaceae bacterium]|nr:substrate-binding domain-containing protein [Planctomycetaceae bacterium]